MSSLGLENSPEVNQGRERRKTVARSFRIDDSALRIVGSDAVEAGVSVNTYLNQLLTSYKDFDRYFFKSPRNPLVSDLVGDLVGMLPDEVAAEAGRRLAQNFIRPMILSKYGSMNLGSVLECYRLFAEHAKPYSIYETETSGRRTITLIHNWGSKGSIFLAQDSATLFEMINLKPKITTTDKSVTISI